MKIKWHIESRKINKLKEWAKNPRLLTEKGLADLTKSITKFGLAEPLVVNTCGTIAGGHGRLKILKAQGETECDCYVPDRKLTEKEFEELNIRLNANTAGIWDIERLANEWELPELLEWGLDPINFGQPEATEDDYVIPDEIKTDIVAGDLFEIGQHRLLCGDCNNILDIQTLMQGKKGIGICDPPYNVGLKYKTHNDEKTKKEYLKWCDKWFAHLGKITDKQIIFIGNINSKFWIKEFNPDYITIWDKGDGATTHGYITNYTLWEPIFFHGKFKQKRHNDIFRYNASEGQKLNHPCPKPVKLIGELIENFTEQADIIIDLFLGSGTTLVAGQQLGRKVYAMEISPQYVQVCIDRMKKAFPEIKIKRNGEVYKAII